MGKTIKINFRDIEEREFPTGITLKEISEAFSHYFNYPILIGKVDNDIVELDESINRSYKIELYDRTTNLGSTIYGRTCQFLLVVAVKKLLGNDVEVIIQHSIDKGFYCELEGCDLDKPIVDRIAEKMREISAMDLRIQKMSVSRFDAIKYFEKRKQFDKVHALKYISNTYVNLYRIDDIYDYFYGKLAYTTKDINDFKLTYIKDNGFVLNYPTTYTPDFTLDYVHHEKLFDKYLSFTRWGNTIGVTNAAELNELVSKNKYDELVRLSEVYYNNQLVEVADKIYEDRKNIKLVLIAGPSSAGKTTTSKKLQVYLQSKGIKPHQISIDDYFFDRDKTKVLPNGELDTESLNAVDVTLFNKHLTKLLDGEKVELPEYNFVLGKREYKGKYLQVGKDDMIIIEGLHGINDDLTMSIDRRLKYKIYISPLTQLNIDNHNRIHTSDTRKLRRIVRDSKFRGKSATDTLHMWKAIREGEEKYIFPYQDGADYIINSALVYEIGVLKVYAEPLLFNVSENDESYPEALRLINLLRNFLPIPNDSIPNDSVLREFIGGSSFNKE
ncbi:MAG: nucleoside kinase [Lactobacillales bacterium]|nr:nucleoside kinase [Lactobacillales bacterium]